MARGSIEAGPVADRPERRRDGDEDDDGEDHGDEDRRELPAAQRPDEVVSLFLVGELGRFAHAQTPPNWK